MPTQIRQMPPPQQQQAQQQQPPQQPPPPASIAVTTNTAASSPISTATSVPPPPTLSNSIHVLPDDAPGTVEPNPQHDGMLMLIYKMQILHIKHILIQKYLQSDLKTKFTIYMYV